jgi:hypothetical protein
VLNHVNPGTPVGSLPATDDAISIANSLFGKSTSLAGGPFSSAAANRKIELQATFSF